MTLNELGHEQISSRVKASPQEGVIFMDAQRMLLVDTSRMGFLRQELISTLGMERAKGVLMRMGFASGARDLEWAKKILGDKDPEEILRFGPRLHSVRGGASTRVVKIDIDIRNKHFYGEFIWDQSYEADVHKDLYGTQDEAVCWEAVGYATGYTSALMGCLVYYREVECRGKGDSICRIIGKPVDQWDDLDESVLKLYQPDPVVERLLDMQKSIDLLRREADEGFRNVPFLGKSKGFRDAIVLADKVARSDVTVLLLGETGVGKERFARYIHEQSNRSKHPFVAVNCGAIPEELIEAELFGVEKGAYTGAQTSRAGKFERADGGTLLLDEVGELSASAQTKLLRALQEEEIERVGGTQCKKINVRIIAATNVDLAEAVRKGRFRLDLYYRLNIYPISIPPLRQRRSDIELLAEDFLRIYSSKHAKKLLGITDAAKKILTEYAWPGNIRELQNMIERGVILASNRGYIDEEHLILQGFGTQERETSTTVPNATTTSDADPSFGLLDQMIAHKQSMEDLQNDLVLSAVNRAGGNLSDAAKFLGLSRAQVSYTLKKIKQ
ncbi:MAG TPA: sigma 54-interacting transcriptional regulator [Noviherbaspirillum sp.]|uniref:sigma 54-interacting transcriptional regulator n=1 Tax=Noviherbaspirillum sp. TaxID=1926288 RepID=UPI002B476B0D|nr:sigma 54-interacting transcriptional regulator [Noviherbaspirillum sp.]HJV84983.1 sigma 54-interacting transcriptional regulator [Noviherbaspirillum sp.]